MFVVLVVPMVVAVISVFAIAVGSVCLIVPSSYWCWRCCSRFVVVSVGGDGGGVVGLGRGDGSYV